MGKPNGGLLGMAAAIITAAVLFSANAAYAQSPAFNYWTAEGMIVSVPNNQLKSNGDGTISIISAEEAAALESQEQEQEQEVGHQVDQDLDCSDYTERNFPAETTDERYGLDRDNDGIACETQTAPNGTTVIVDPNPANVTQEAEVIVGEIEQEAQIILPSAIKSEIIHHMDFALQAINAGDIGTARIELQAAVDLILLAIATQEEQAQQEQEQQPAVEPEPEPEVVTNASEVIEPQILPQPEEEEEVMPAEPEVIVEEAQEQVPTETPIGSVQGNSIFVEQLNLEAAGIFQECIDALINASIVFIVGQIVENVETPEQAEVVTNNTEAIVEAVQNNTEITETVVDVVGENLGEIVSNQTTVEEVFEEEVKPEVEEEIPEVVEESGIVIEEITI